MKLKWLIPSIFVSVVFLNCTEKPAFPVTTVDYFSLVRAEFNGDIALETTGFVEQFWRVAGNTGFNKSIYRVISKLEEAGYVQESTASPNDRLTYRLEKRALKRPTWEPVNASLTLVDSGSALLNFATNRNMICQNSFSTIEGGIIGEVVYIDNLEALANENVLGKIVYAEMSPNRLFQKAVIDGGAIGIITYNNPSYLQPEKNRTSIQFRSIPYNKSIKAWGIALSYEANEQLKTALLDRPVKVKVDITTKIYPSEELTVVANIAGAELPTESLVFSAHIQEPGANDNATGVGTQLEMAIVSARLMSAGKINLKRTITFLWGDEIISTRRYITEDGNRTAKINWGISLDMVGENTAKTGGTFLIEKMPDPSAIWTRGDDKHTEWGSRQLALEDMKPHYLNDFIINIFRDQGKYANWPVNTNPYEGGSDHTPFLRNNIPGLLLWHFTDQFYHTDNDRLDKVSQETMKNVGVSALVSAYTLVNADTETAEQIITIVKDAAITRLNEEFNLSKMAVSQGNSIANEVEILSAWNDWYIDALGSIEDLTPKPNKVLSDKIFQSQTSLNKLTNSLIKNLDK